MATRTRTPKTAPAAPPAAAPTAGRRRRRGGSSAPAETPAPEETTTTTKGNTQALAKAPEAKPEEREKLDKEATATLLERFGEHPAVDDG